MPVVLLSKPLLNHSARKSARFVGAENSLAGLSRWLPICRAVGNPFQFVNLTWGTLSLVGVFWETGPRFCWIFSVIYAGFSGNSVEIIIQ